MNTKQLITLCTNQASSTDLDTIKQFLSVIKAKYISAIKKYIFQLLSIEVFISVFFGAITHNFTLSLFASVSPFLLLVFIGYGIMIASRFIHLNTTMSHIKDALINTSEICVCPDCYTFEREDRHRIGNDTSSELMQSYCFQKTGAAYGQRLYVAKNNHNCFFDCMEKGGSYKLFAVSNHYLLFIRADY